MRLLGAKLRANIKDRLMKKCLIVFVVFCSFQISWSQTGPIEEEIQFSGLVVDLETYSTMPVGGPGPEHTTHPDNRARINMMREVPGSDKIAVIDLNGYLYLMDNAGNLDLYINFWDHFNDFIDGSGKGTGSGAMAFHPEFASNGIFYTSHAERDNAGTPDFSPIEGSTSCQWVITRWVASDPSAATFSGTKEIIARLEFTTNIHGMQDITFNPFASPGDEDYGLLYVCNGEGGGSERGFHDNIGKLESYLGTIWRIDPEGNNSTNGKYGIPDTNPYFNTSGAIKEIWAYGFRNPHRLSFEQRDGETILLAGDIGQHNIEEINLIEKGGNYGWDHREGTFQYNWNNRSVSDLPNPDNGDFIYPVAQYDHSEGAAIALGYTWTDPSHTLLNGQLLFSDILYGDLFHVPLDSLIQGRQYEIREAKVTIDGSEEGTFLEVAPSGRIDLRFFRSSDGKVWMFTKSDGNIYKVDIPDGTQNVKPSAVIGIEETRGNVPFEVMVDASDSHDFDNDALSYSWDFGDGATMEGITASHTYNTGGTFIITLTVHDGQDSDESQVEVHPNSVPVATFTISGDSTKVPTEITFDGTGSVDADGDNLTYAWDISGAQFFGRTVDYTFDEVGEYQVRLTALDRKGGEGRLTKTLTITNVLGISFLGNPKSEVTIYPNPVKETLFVDSDKQLTFQIYTLSGKTILAGNIEANTRAIDITSLDAGEYILKLVSGSEEYSGQLFIKN